jgi:hypothetical protein
VAVGVDLTVAVVAPGVVAALGSGNEAVAVINARKRARNLRRVYGVDHLHDFAPVQERGHHHGRAHGQGHAHGHDHDRF